MRFKFSGPIPNKKNNLVPNRWTKKLMVSGDYDNFCKKFKLQIQQKYPELFIQIKHLPKPILVALHYRKAGHLNFDFDGRISTVLDAMQKIELIGNDRSKEIKMYPGELIEDERTVITKQDRARRRSEEVGLNEKQVLALRRRRTREARAVEESFELEFLSDVKFVPIESF